MVVSLADYLVLSALLFALGVAGFLLKKDLITVFISIELMLNAVNLSFVAFSHYLRHNAIDGNLFVFFVMVVAATEAAVGLAIIIAVVRNRNTLNIDKMDLMKN